MKDLSADLLRIDAKLTAGGVPPLSDRWREDLVAFYKGGYRVHAGRMGRGASKSTNAAKCLVVEVLCGEWIVPPGERHWAINISENIDEARARLGQIEQYLQILRIGYERVGEQILLSTLPLGFWARPARIGALSGPRLVAWSVDEAAKLNVDGQNPAEELVASLKAASVTHSQARGRVYSSPWGCSGYHYEVIEAGTSEHTLVSVGATWDYAPWLTQEQTRKLEPDPRKHAREYEAIPSAGSSVFEPQWVERAMLPRAKPLPIGRRLAITDPSSGRGDTWALLIAGRCEEPTGDRYERRADGSILMMRSGPMMRHGWTETPPYLRVTEVTGWEGRFAETLAWPDLLSQLVLKCRANNIEQVYSDQHNAYTLEGDLRTQKIKCQIMPWTESTKILAVERLQHLFRTNAIQLPPHDKLRRELLAFAEVYSSNGGLTFKAKHVAHDDYVMALALLGLVDAMGLVPRGSEPMCRHCHMPSNSHPVRGGFPYCASMPPNPIPFGTI